MKKRENEGQKEAYMMLGRDWVSVVLLSLLMSISVFAEERVDLVSRIQKLYPHLEEIQLENSLNLTENSFGFLRSFVPYFYEEAKTYSLTQKTLSPMKTESGWCVGDAHLENFGALLDDQGHSQFSMNDLDDCGPCPLLLDTLRFLTGVRLHDESFDLNPLLDAYRMGLRGQERSLSAEAEALLSLSQSAGRSLSKKSQQDSFKSNRNIESQNLSAQESKAVEKAVGEALGPAFKILDIYKTRKAGGGSHGILRYKILVQNNSADQQMELKELVAPGVFPVATTLIGSQKERIQTCLNVVLGENQYSHLYQAVQIGKTSYLLRPKWKGNMSIDLSDYTSPQVKKIAEDEIWTLGKIHRKTARPSFVQGVQKSVNGDWIKATEDLSQLINTSFRTLKRRSGPLFPKAVKVGGDQASNSDDRKVLEVFSLNMGLADEARLYSVQEAKHKTTFKHVSGQTSRGLVFSGAKIRTRGDSDAEDPSRKNFNIHFRKPVDIFPRASLRKLVVRGLAEDRFFVNELYGFAAFKAEGLFHSDYRLVKLIINNKLHGLAILVEPPELSLKRKYPEVAGVVRRNYEDLFLIKTNEKGTSPDFLATGVSELLKISTSKSEKINTSELVSAMNLEEYFKYTSLNRILRNGDYTDELFFTVDNNKRLSHLSGWDFEELFSDKPHKNRRNFLKSGVESLLYSNESSLDRAISQDCELYRLYLEVLEKSLPKWNIGYFNAIKEEVLSTVKPYFAEASVRDFYKMDFNQIKEKLDKEHLLLNKSLSEMPQLIKRHRLELKCQK
jgi:uncharacterized protein (DUF2252 family)